MNRQRFLTAFWLATCFAASLHAEPPSGPAVLLRSDQVLYGEARQEGEKVVVEGPTSTITLHRREVACWGESIEALYQYKLDRRPADSLRHLLNDAKWCLQNGLYDQTRTELENIRQLAGRIPEAVEIEQRMKMELERQAALRQPPRENVQQVAATSDNAQAIELPKQLFHTTSIQKFTSNIQPLLINRCATAGCHGARPAAHPHFDGWRFGITAPITNRNLQEVGRFIDADRPDESRLLRMAFTPHGGSAALSSGLDQNLRDRLLDWVYFASGVPHSSHSAAPSLIPSASVSGYPVNTSGVDNAMGMAPIPIPNASDRRPRESNQPVPGKAQPPEKLPTVSDPFDPDIFNRSYSQP